MLIKIWHVYPRLKVRDLVGFIGTNKFLLRDKPIFENSTQIVFAQILKFSRKSAVLDSRNPFLE